MDVCAELKPRRISDRKVITRDLASSSPAQHPANVNTPQTGSLWMLELASKRILQLASRRRHGENIFITGDGRILVAETNHIDEIALIRAPKVTAISVPVFESAETWNALEGQPLRISLFAYDPDNSEFAPKIRLTPTGSAIGDDLIAPSVTYQVTGLPEGASFDAETMELVWTPAYNQAGTYLVNVTATDNGDGTGSPATSTVTLPMIVRNANRAPEIGDISHAFVDKGAELDIPISATDIDGNPIQLTISGLPRFATYTQNPSGAGGVIHFAPHENSRGDYTITVIAQDNGDGDINQVLTQAKSFVLTVRSLSEAPVLTMPKQVVAIAGQPLSVALSVSDLDQDALSFSANGLPINATLTPSTSYGQAVLTWTPTTDDLGLHDIVIQVTDSGLSPSDAGYTQPANPIPNIITQNFRIMVRDANVAPELLGVQLNGVVLPAVGSSTALNATEGVPLTLDVFARDSEGDVLNWTAANLPAGMVMQAADSAHIRLSWTPDFFAAQSNQGQYSFTLQASDGSAVMSHTFTISVANINQTPKLLPMPLQLIREGDTLNFTVRGVDADNDPLRLGLIYDENTPQGVFFDAATGSFEWTPDQNTVNNAIDGSIPYTFTFQAKDGSSTTQQTVQVRVLDVNHAPKIAAGNHAVVVGQSFSLPISLAKPSTSSTGINAWDEDGAAQTQSLSISFTHLPEGASYDANIQRLNWMPSPAQVGDVTIIAQVSDGKNTTTQTLTLRVVADAHANAPKVLVSTTPSTPALPNQLVVATVRADSYAPIQSITVQVRGSGLGSDAWQTVALDSAGRLRLTPTQAGLIEIQATATDQDGFSTTETQLIRVKNPADTEAPVLNWSGALLGATASSRPVTITTITDLAARVEEQQFMSYRLSIAPAQTQQWQTLREQFLAAVDMQDVMPLTALNPATLPNGVYTLRLTATDLAGRTSEIEARVIIDSAEKVAALQTTDAIFNLAGHDLAFTRTMNTASGDFANGALPLLNLHLTHDQLGETTQGSLAPWQEGARVWLQVPSSVSTPNATLQNLSFTLSTTPEALSTTAGAPVVYHPAFSTSQGWTLTAHSSATATQENPQRQGSHLYDATTGLPWTPTSYTLTAPDGIRYELDEQGKVSQIRFADGVQWMVSDAGIVATTGDLADRLDLIRDDHGRISRVTSSETSLVYRYDAQNRLILVRNLQDNATGTSYAYDSSGNLLTDTITANLGAAVSWNTTGAWQGELSASQATTLSFSVRESELASTVKAAGAQGAIVVAIESTGDASFEVTGSTVLGTATHGATKTTLLRITEAGLKLIRMSGHGTATLRVSLAGDLNSDGKVDGTDSQHFALGSSDIDGNGHIDAADRQLLYANYGWKANQAPIAAATLPITKTHTDLSTKLDLHTLADDLEGDTVFWKIVGSAHGTAKLSSDGETLLFTPEAGYSGEAKVTVQADDGFASSALIELTVNVSGAKLIAIHLTPITSLKTGQTVLIQATGDFEDEKGVQLNAGDYLTTQVEDIRHLGYIGTYPVDVDSVQDLIMAKQTGSALVSVSHMNADGSLIRAVTALNVQASNSYINNAFLDNIQYIQPDVYPGTLTLVPEMQRQLKVHIINVNTNAVQDIQIQQTRYISSDESIATVSDTGLITALRSGHTTISIVHISNALDENGTIRDQYIGQTTIQLNVQEASQIDDNEQTTTPSSITIMKDSGGAVSAATGETVLIGEGVLDNDTTVSISRITLDSIKNNSALTLPAPDILNAISAFNLKIGENATRALVQLAIPIQGTANVGDEVYFFRKGIILDSNGVAHDTWWLVDNGYVNDNFVARTASPPYSGIMDSGDYLVMKSSAAAGLFSSLLIGLSSDISATFTELGFSLAGNNKAIDIGHVIGAINRGPVEEPPKVFVLSFVHNCFMEALPLYALICSYINVSISKIQI